MIKTFALALSVAVTAPSSPALPIVAPSVLPNDVPGAALPMLQEHSYTMSGRVRMLLLWFGRDDVGSGTIRWRGNSSGRGYELLIGSDPLRAPGKLNRWGYLAEAVEGSESAVVGVISKSSEDRLADVRSAAAPASARPFDTIRGRVTSHQAFARTATVQASQSTTYREAATVLNLAFGAGSDKVRQIDRPNGVRPGFLSSVAELIHDTVTSSTVHARTPPARSLPYVYGDRLFDLRLLDATPMARFAHAGRVYDDVIRAYFDTGALGSRDRSRFELVYGTRGPLAEIPILISYQPKWWLQVELTIQR